MCYVGFDVAFWIRDDPQQLGAEVGIPGPIALDHEYGKATSWHRRGAFSFAK
jgi:hypothetical protein